MARIERNKGETHDDEEQKLIARIRDEMGWK